MYSKKVIERFTKPKYSGEMKDADAVGEVGNLKCGDVMRVYIKVKGDVIKKISFLTYGCLPPTEKIVIKAGDWKEIRQYHEFNTLLNGEGKKTNIKEVSIRSYEGKLLNFIPFVSPFNSFSITPNHPILCIRRTDLKITRKASFKCHWLRINHEELSFKKPYFIEARNLQAGDYLIFAYNSQIQNKRIYSTPTLRLIGYYLAEGYLVANGRMIAFAFNKNETEYIKEVKNLIRKMIHKEPNSRIRGNVEEVYVSSTSLANFLLKSGGKIAKRKKICDEIMMLPPKKQLELIKTYLNGDGDSYRRREHNSLTYRLATTSENLAIQFQEILARNGIFASIRKERRKDHIIEGRHIKGHHIFIVAFKNKRKHQFVHVTKRYFLIPIKEIKKKNFKGKVYNLHVSSKPNSYLVRGFVVHNCVAAIASSDAMCELAKGKTIDEALKITAKDIADELGTLPPIKFHCSVLGTEALKKAVEEYRKRK